MKKYNPTHPGEILLKEFLKPLRITQRRLAKDLVVPAMRVNKIVHGKRGLSADTALRLSRYFGTSAEFWMNIQSHYDLEMAKITIGDTLTEVKIFAKESSGSSPVWQDEGKGKS